MPDDLAWLGVAEAGRLFLLLDAAGAQYAGCDAAASGLTMDKSRTKAAAPVRQPATSALMSPSTNVARREFASAIRQMSRTSSPFEYSLTPGKIVPSWKTSVVSVQ